MTMADKVTCGQGEYVVFHAHADGTRSVVSKDTFEKVYQIFNEYRPMAIAQRRSLAFMDEIDHRYDLIRAEVKALDPTLEVVFIPRTLYELFFIRKCIREDLKHGDICPYSNLALVESMKHRNQCVQRRDKCWHLCCFTDFGDDNDVGVKEVAFRLNKAIVKALSPPIDGLTKQAVLDSVKEHIEFLKGLHIEVAASIKTWRFSWSRLYNLLQKFVKRVYEDFYKLIFSEKKSMEGAVAEAENESQQEKKHYRINLHDIHYPVMTANFFHESDEYCSMSVCNGDDEQLIDNAVLLECSEIAKLSFLLYRGSAYKQDSTCEDGSLHSLSFGTSLFAGCVHDVQATAFYYMKQKRLFGYAISIPFDQLERAPFVVPSSHTVSQLFGCGEVFHSRTKAWRGCDLHKVSGMYGGDIYEKEYLRSDLDKDELEQKFQEYRGRAIVLKKAVTEK
jgi:hypothetical protein